MSWISEFAGKAENFLNQIDQNAAVALNSVDTETRTKTRPNQKETAAVVSSVETVDNSQINKYSISLSKSSSKESILDKNSESNENGGNNINEPLSTKIMSSHSKSQIVVPNRLKPPRKVQSPRQTALEPPPTTTVVNGHFQKSAKTTDQELLDFLNSPDQKEIDVNSLLKTELDTQNREMSLLLRANKKLQQDYETLEKSLNPNLLESRKSSDENHLAKNIKDLMDQITEKDFEINRLGRCLEQALEKLQLAGELQNGENRIQLLERENRQLNTQCQEFSSNLESSTATYELSEKQNKSLKETLSSLEKEYSSYKDKAKIILKNKDDIIASIKTRAMIEEEEQTANEFPENQFLSEIGSLRNERELLHAEITQSRVYMESMRDENNRIEEELQNLRLSNSNLQKLLSKEKKKYDLIQEENLQLSQNISSLQLLLEREKIDGKKTQEKYEKYYDQNLNSVMNSLGTGITKSSSLSDFSVSATRSGYSDMDETENLRTRIAALSQSLLEKQNLINSLSSDKQLLQIRCERFQVQLEGLNSSPGSLGNEANVTHSVVSSQPLYLSESPWDSRMATRVKRVYSTLDSFCCTIGLVLRQRPNLRLGFCVYILCLHLWVFLILFTWAHHTSVSGSHHVK